eukprot:Partr_v1_DN28239_c0_g1_i2_m75934 putative Retinoblastoma-like
MDGGLAQHQHHRQHQQEEPQDDAKKRQRIDSFGPGGQSLSHPVMIMPPVMPEKSDKADSTTPFTETLAWREMAAKLHSYCQSLNLDIASKAMADELLRDFVEASPSSSSGSLTMFGHVYCSVALWIACCLSSRMKHGDATGGGVGVVGVSLSQIFLAAQIQSSDFFAKLPAFIANSPRLDDDSCQFIKSQVEASKLEHSTMTNTGQRMKQLFVLLITASNSNAADPAARKNEEMFISDCMTFTWLLYLYGKEKLLPISMPSAEMYYMALFCAFRFTARHIPSGMITTIGKVMAAFQMEQPAEIDDLSQPWTQYEHILWPVILKYFCVNTEQFAANEKIFLALVEKELISSNKWTFTKYENGIMTDVFDVRNRNGIAKNLEVINREYQMLQKLAGSLDGRYFLNRRTIGSLTPRKVGCTPSAVQKTAVSSARNLKTQLQRATTLSAAMMSTPLTAKTMSNKRTAKSYADDDYTTGERLRMILNSQCDGPTLALQGYFSHCKPDPTNTILDRVTKSINKLMTIAPNEAQIYQLACKFYYRTMELMLRGEESGGTPREKLWSTLHEPKFHSSLLCCALELTRHCFRISSFSFETLIHYLDVSVFDLCMVIELSIKYDGQMLNWNLVKRLKEIEERILECEIWKSEEPLYRFMANEESRLSADGSISSPRKALNYVTQTPNYVQGREFTANIASVSQPQNNTAPASSLEIFFRKLYRLLYSRLVNLSQALQIPTTTVEHIWGVVVEALLVERENRVFYKRHIDQVIICTIYGVGRYQKLDMKITDIILHYQRQPQSNRDLTSDVQLNDGRTGSLIDYYNQDYIPNMKALIYSLSQESPQQQQQQHQQHVIHPVPIAPINGLARVQSNSSNAVPMTPRTRVLFNPGECMGKLGMNGGGNQRQSRKAPRKLNFGGGGSGSGLIRRPV